ncbi:amidase [Kaistia algarum]|uniref:amidase n=1 Tax=Kaistia algarum TaxID=2083279 RepID=UPI001402113F|nr:amidase [Kaistia algarum]MCX5514966.1 amidase [Kaistia algarum]
MNTAEYAAQDAVGLAGLIARREVSAEELIDATIEAIERLNPSLNAVVHRFYDEARAALRAGLPGGRFHGVPFLLKDLDVAMRGVPLSEGSRLMSDYIPDFDATIVARYRAAGLVILGRTNSAELGLSFTTEPLAHGPTRHPLDSRLSPGGSSGGSAAAVASGMVPMAHATDGGGSIRQPAALTGLFGLKPTRGRTPPGPDRSEIFFGISVGHAITRTVRDSAALLDATCGHEPGAVFTPPEPAFTYESMVEREPPRLRMALQSEPFNGATVDKACRAALDNAARLMEAMGHHVEFARPDLSGLDFGPATALLAGAFTADKVEAYAAKAGIADPYSLLEPAHAAFVRESQPRSARDAVAALEIVRAVERRYAGFFERWDVILSPVTATSELPLGWLSAEVGDLAEVGRRAAAHAPFTAPYNLAGVPAMSVPFPQQGKPVGVQFAAAFGREDLLFSLAAAIERAKPWM